jgi:hypothetical protein
MHISGDLSPPVPITTTVTFGFTQNKTTSESTQNPASASCHFRAPQRALPERRVPADATGHHPRQPGYRFCVPALQRVCPEPDGRWTLMASHHILSVFTHMSRYEMLGLPCLWHPGNSVCRRRMQLAFTARRLAAIGDASKYAYADCCWYAIGCRSIYAPVRCVLERKCPSGCIQLQGRRASPGSLLVKRPGRN